MREVLPRFRPEVVFHAAAYKHVVADGGQPARGGAQQRDRHARRARAAPPRPAASASCWSRPTRRSKPATALGASKAMAEWIVEARARAIRDTLFCCVRFGNVLGSTGSVVPLFRRQIEQGGPVTVTDERWSATS